MGMMIKLLIETMDDKTKEWAPVLEQTLYKAEEFNNYLSDNICEEPYPGEDPHEPWFIVYPGRGGENFRFRYKYI
jgi:hypothetical protein